MTYPESITVILGAKLKRELEDYNYHHRKSKINMSQVCREALEVELKNKITCEYNRPPF